MRGRRSRESAQWVLSRRPGRPTTLRRRRDYPDRRPRPSWMGTRSRLARHLACSRRAAGCSYDMDDGVDQREVGEGLRKVAKVATRRRVDLFREQLQRAPECEQLLAELPRTVDLADFDQGRDKPERADRERSLLTQKPVIGLVDAISQHEPVH